MIVCLNEFWVWAARCLKHPRIYIRKNEKGFVSFEPGSLAIKSQSRHLPSLPSPTAARTFFTCRFVHTPPPQLRWVRRRTTSVKGYPHHGGRTPSRPRLAPPRTPAPPDLLASCPFEGDPTQRQQHVRVGPRDREHKSSSSSWSPSSSPSPSSSRCSTDTTACSTCAAAGRRAHS